MDENKCKVYLLSGFLGSGKTTLLKHLLETHPENERVAVLMNEFGKAGVDGDVVRKNGLEIIEISRGSIFCACAKGDFLRGLYTILKDYRPTILLVEASGVADTTDMKKDLGHGMLHDYYRFAGNICVIDAQHFEDWLDLFNAVIKQTEAATQLIINKTDLVTPEEADALEKHLHELNPTAQITRTHLRQRAVERLPLRRRRREDGGDTGSGGLGEVYRRRARQRDAAHGPAGQPSLAERLLGGRRGEVQRDTEQAARGRCALEGLFRRHGRQMEGLRHSRQQKPPSHTDASPDFSQPRNLAIFIRKVRARREIPALFQDAGLKLLELRF